MKIVNGQKVQCAGCGRKYSEAKTQQANGKYVCFNCINGIPRPQLELRQLTTAHIEEERLRYAGRFQ